jgi:hypothetical protein
MALLQQMFTPEELAQFDKGDFALMSQLTERGAKVGRILNEQGAKLPYAKISPQILETIEASSSVAELREKFR